MILYHGSNVEVREPVLTRSRAALDFGVGFYTTTDYKQARKWAMRVSKWRGGEPTITVFETNEEAWSRLSILRFDSAGKDWLEYVVRSRTLQAVDSRHDVVAGPVADDRTVNVINLFLEGTITESMALELLLPMRFTDQWAMKTDAAIEALNHRETIAL
ncbi:MAG: DUF3990 domain-containing protein [Atopobiaceae bacterium]|nr:DUF3990 domain-containing protein [Atopobiaceae bacterium]